MSASETPDQIFAGMASGSLMSVCRLCAGPGPLRNSHIISELLYKSMYDEKHRMVGVNASTDRDPDLLQKGLREPMLCGGCEGRLQKNEVYAARVLQDLPDLSAHQPGDVVTIPGVDYRRFKLFEISLLWRMGVASMPTFGTVQLGPRHEKALRERILADDPGEPWEYGCLLIRPHGAGPVDQLLVQPRLHRVEGHRTYLMIMAGFVWVFFASSHSREIAHKAGFVTPSGLVVLIASESAADFMKHLGRNLRSAGFRL